MADGQRAISCCAFLCEKCYCLPFLMHFLFPICVNGNIGCVRHVRGFNKKGHSRWHTFLQMQEMNDCTLETSCVKLPVTTLSYYSTSTTPLCSVFILRSPAHPHWSLQCDRYKSIDIEVSISISILLRQSIDIGIDETTILLKPASISNIGDTFGKYR